MGALLPQIVPSGSVSGSCPPLDVPAHARARLSPAWSSWADTMGFEVARPSRGSLRWRPRPHSRGSPLPLSLKLPLTGSSLAAVARFAPSNCAGRWLGPSLTSPEVVWWHTTMPGTPLSTRQAGHTRRSTSDAGWPSLEELETEPVRAPEVDRAGTLVDPGRRLSRRADEHHTLPHQGIARGVDVVDLEAARGGCRAARRRPAPSRDHRVKPDRPHQFEVRLSHRALSTVGGFPMWIRHRRHQHRR